MAEESDVLVVCATRSLQIEASTPTADAGLAAMAVPFATGATPRSGR
jgi:hypothetical protein